MDELDRVLSGGGEERSLPQDDGKELVDRYGFPAFKNEKGKLSKLNEPFWAAYYAAHETEILFEADEEEFYYYDEETGLFCPPTHKSITRIDRTFPDTSFVECDPAND